MSVKKKVANPEITSDMDKTYFCTACGKVYATANTKFYRVSYSPAFKSNDGYAHICTACAKKMFEEYKRKFEDQRLATMIMCAKFDYPYYHSLYESINLKQEKFTFGLYVRQLNGVQYRGKTFASTLADGELERTVKESVAESEEYWSVDEKRAKNEVIKLLGHDPFDGYSSKDRKYLFSEMQQYLNDEELLEDQYKMTQLIQLINNNNQINQYDVAISKLNPINNADDIEKLSKLKKDLVTSNDKIAAQNGFSVKSKGGQRAGKNTLTGLMRDMREKNLDEIAANFYKQLQSPASRWGSDVSIRSMSENCAFDENDVNDIIEEQRSLVTTLQDENDNLKETKRLLKIQEVELNEYIKSLEKKVLDLGGELDG